ncbi:MAG: helix-turn-helix transcriptional regulator [Saprospiraceae bacterium]|nr:helix-turn-helix transcriptional regulator [Saprospiraceae bacterium]
MSERETPVFRHVSDGKTTKDIAKILFVSIPTVEIHRPNIMKRLDVQNTLGSLEKAAYLNLL